MPASAIPRGASLVFLAHYHDLYGGAEMCLDELLQGLGLSRPDLQLHVVVPAEGELSTRYRKMGLSVHVIPNRRWADARSAPPASPLELWWTNRTASVALARLLRTVRPLTAITNTVTPPALAFAARRARIPHVWMLHEFGNELSFRRGHARTFEMVGRLSELVVTNSLSLKQAVEAKLGNTPCEAAYQAVEVPPGINPNAGRNPADSLRSVHIGRLTESKGQETAIRAVARAADRGADLTLDLVGPGDRQVERRLVRLIRELRLPERVRVHNGREQPWPHYCRSHVAIVTSHEAFGRVTVEAQKCALAVCAQASGASPEIISHGATGLLHRPGDVEQLADHLFTMWRDEARRREIAARARKFAMERYTLQRYAARMIDLLENHIAQQPQLLHSPMDRQ